LNWTRNRLVATFVSFLGISALFGVVSWKWIAPGVVSPKPPDGVRCFENTQEIAVRPNDPEEWNQRGYQQMQFARLKSGEIVAPVLQIVRPNFRGLMGGVRHDPVWECQVHFLGGGQGRIDIPVDSEIDLHIILIRRLDGPGKLGGDPWRVWEIDTIVLRNAGFVVLPRIETLEIFDNREDKNAMLARQNAGAEFAEKLERR